MAKRRRVQSNASALLEKLCEIQSTPLPPRHPKKPFNPANPEIPLLDNYEDFPDKEFWNVFPRQRNTRAGTPFKLDVQCLEKWVQEAGATEELVELLEEVKKDIVNGADLKVDEGYKPTESRNAKSAYSDGKYVTDEIASGLKTGIFAGPFSRSEIPKNVTVNSLQTAPKPNGKVRIILNMSTPKEAGVNDFIRKEHYPCEMGGMKELVWAINYCGKGAKFAKCDWNAAYKHIAVAQNQLCYQWFRWLQMFFVELCLIFGCISSVGLYDRLARMMWLIVACVLSYPMDLIVQHLDDLCMIGNGEDGRLEQIFGGLFNYWC